MNLSIEPGEILFIVGENGCGKTSLIKLLLGLYTPQRGEVRLNGKAVGPEGLDDYRQLFTTVFADYYLFDDLPEHEHSLPSDATRYLERLEIAHKVTRTATVPLPPPTCRPASASAWHWSMPGWTGGRCWCSTNGQRTRTRPSAGCSTPSCCRT